MAKQFDFGTNQILRAEFLNALQDVLSSYLDMMVLTYAGAQVLAEATTDDPIAITLDGWMRSIPTTLAVTPSGGAGSRDVFIVLRTGGFELETYLTGNVPTVSAGEVYRRVGTCTWDGTFVTGVHTFATRLNADFLGGRTTSYTPEPYSVAVSGDDGTLHPDWFPEVSAVEEPLGTVKRLWAPTNALVSVPTAWVLMQGQTLASGQHSFPGGGSIAIPDMRNKMGLGADPAKPHAAAGTPVDSAAGAPGIGGITGSNANGSLAHTHGVNGHRHLRFAHEHLASHTHLVSGHQHQQPLRSVPHDTSPGGVNEQRGTYNYTSGDGGVTASSLPSLPNMFSHDLTHGNAANLISDPGSYNSNAALGAVDKRPAHRGLVYLLKVH